MEPTFLDFVVASTVCVNGRSPLSSWAVWSAPFPLEQLSSSENRQALCECSNPHAAGASGQGEMETELQQRLQKRREVVKRWAPCSSPDRGSMGGSAGDPRGILVFLKGS